MFLLNITIVQADLRHQNDASKVVRGWLKQTQGKHLDVPLGQAIRKVDTFADSNGDPIYHIVYLESSGFVIVPGEDEIEPIIGFVLEGEYDPSLDNPLGALVTQDLSLRIAEVHKGNGNIRRNDNVFKDHQSKWYYLESCNAVGDSSEKLQLTTISDIRVMPLVQSRWNQNDECSADCYDIYTPNHFPCGCVATAMAQLMRYYQHPANPNGTGPFQIWVNGISQNNFLRGGDGNGGNYDWNNMVLDPTCSITQTQRNAIGALCYDAGVVVNMSYSQAGSNANTLDVAVAFVNTFNYNNAIRGYNSSNNIGAGLNGMLNPNLDAAYPCLLGIAGTPGGHAIVCDGYGYDNSTLYHHLNLGWSGTSDAWYDLPNITNTAVGTFNSVYKCVYNIYVSGSGEIVSGRVTDESENPINGAEITATTGGDTYTAITDVRGIYALPNLPSSSSFTVQANKSGYNFTSRTVNTGTSTDLSATSGNVWGADFMPDSAPTNHAPILSKPRVNPTSGTESTTFEFLVDYYDPDGDPPHPDYRRVYISGDRQETMTLKSGTESNGTYRYPTTLPVGSYYHSFFFADTEYAHDSSPWEYGPLVFSDDNVAIEIVIQCVIISSDLRLKYSLTGPSGPWTDIPITKQILDPIAVPSDSTVYFSASTASPNYQYREWESGSLHGTNSGWLIPAPLPTVVNLNVFYNYSPQQYEIRGTVLRDDGAFVPGGVDLTLTSSQQTMLQHTDAGVFLFTGVKGGVPINITASASGYAFAPPSLVIPNIQDNWTNLSIIAYSSDVYVPMTSFLTVPAAVSEDPCVAFTWVGEDDVTAPENLLYQYTLDGVDTDWSSWALDTSASYEVENGVYTFWVRAKDEVGNINQAPISYRFVVNAAPRIVSAARINNSVWASRITLQMPVGATHPTDKFILLASHSGINEPELVPVQIHPAGDIAPCGANAIVASQLGLPAKIVKVGSGWLVTLPETTPATQTREYDIVWGKIKYFGWQEFVSIPWGFPNALSGDGAASYLDEDLRLWRVTTKYEVRGGTSPYDDDSWVFMNIADKTGPILDETVLQYARGEFWHCTACGTSSKFRNGGVYRIGRTIFANWIDEKYWHDGQDHYSYRYGLRLFENPGTPFKSVDGPYEDRLELYHEPAVHSMLWFTGTQYIPPKEDAIFLVLDENGNEATPKTVFDSIERNDADVSSIKATQTSDANVVLVWNRSWSHTITEPWTTKVNRTEIAYQIRSQNGQQVVRGTARLSPEPLPDSDPTRFDRYQNKTVLSDSKGKTWISYWHYRSDQANEYFYIVLGPDGNIWKGPIQTTAQRNFNFCDIDGYIWAEEGGQFLFLEDDDIIFYGPRSYTYSPNQNVGVFSASVDAQGYRLYDRWSPQPVEIDVPACGRPSLMELFSLNLWDNELHPSNLRLKEGDSTIWEQAGQFTGHTTVDIAGVLHEEQNLLTMTQDDFLGGQVLVTFAYFPSGDLTGNGKVDFQDLGKFADYWLTAEPCANIAPSPIDDKVNFVDFAVVAEHWLEGTE